MEDRVRRGTEPNSRWASGHRSEVKDLADAARQRVNEAKGEAKNYAAEAKE